MNRRDQEEESIHFSTGLGDSIQDITLKYKLDAMAPFREEFPYMLGRLISRDAESNTYEALRISDNSMHAAKKRLNPSTRRDPDNGGLI